MSGDTRHDPYATASEWQTVEEIAMPEAGPRILGFGAHEHVRAFVQNGLRSAGFRATVVVVTDDDAGDARLDGALRADTYDAVCFGAFVTAQDPAAPPSERSTRWFNRLLNVVHRGAPTSRIVLVRGPQHAVADIRRVLAE
jgi:hypothetical protein